MSITEANQRLELQATKCIFCGDAPNLERYPPRFSPEKLSAYTFSARRNRQREHYRIVCCANCGLVRSDPVLKEEVQNQFYRESEFLFSEEAPFAARTYAYLLERLLRQHQGDKPVHSVCEIGCSSGFFLEQCIDLGFDDVIGFEPSIQCRQHAAPKVRDRIITAPFSPEHVAGRRFDLLCSFHVFDHLRNPLQVLSDAATHLNGGGYVFLVCHDVESLGAHMLGSRNPIFDVEHIYLFSKKTISMMLERTGFTTLEVGSLTNTYPLGYWMRMFPGAGGIAQWLPRMLARLPISLRAGNLYAFGRKGGGGGNADR
ncbi:MAG: class I SAM-dependent methyltransferase [Magnetococcales bacterium]|nr:class I SAM-dependent methyltransferase [Magnetococcales bacterium]